MLCGEFPFNINNTESIRNSTIEGTIFKPDSVPKNVSAEAKDLLGKMLHSQ
jgi:hypothetical protein